jgi:hypothetical protein
VIAQYYQLLRLGRQGYSLVARNVQQVGRHHICCPLTSTFLIASIAENPKCMMCCLSYAGCTAHCSRVGEDRRSAGAQGGGWCAASIGQGLVTITTTMYCMLLLLLMLVMLMLSGKQLTTCAPAYVCRSSMMCTALSLWSCSSSSKYKLV